TAAGSVIATDWEVRSGRVVHIARAGRVHAGLAECVEHRQHAARVDLDIRIEIQTRPGGGEFITQIEGVSLRGTIYLRHLDPGETFGDRGGVVRASVTHHD